MLLDLINQWKSAEVGRSALIDDHEAVDLPTLAQRVEAMTAWLKKQHLAAVALLADNSIDWVVTDLAAQQANIICLPLPPFFTPEQQRHCMAEAGIALLIAEPNQALVEATDPMPCPLQRLVAIAVEQTTPAKAAPSGTQKITFTSGSTGTPKGVCLSVSHQWQVASALAQTVALDQPRHLCLLPLATLLENLAGVYAPLLSGGSVYLPSAATRGLSGSSGLVLADMCGAISDTQPNSMIALPQLLSALVLATQSGWQPPRSLRFVAVGGGKVDPVLLAHAANLGIPAFEGYGLSEAGSVVALNTVGVNRAGCSGRVLPHCKVSVENGEVVVSGSCFLGYLGQQDSWHPTRVRTGDLGAIEFADSQQWLAINGRCKNLLITSFGRNISPEWVESTIQSNPYISHCVVVGDGRPCLTALISAPLTVTDNALQNAVDQANAQLPDYARIGHWLRIEAAHWQSLYTANGRPRRDLIQQHFAAAIANGYATNPHYNTATVSPQTASTHPSQSVEHETAQ